MGRQGGPIILASPTPGPGESSQPGRKSQKTLGGYLPLTRIMRDGEKLRDGCGKKRAIHGLNKLHRVSALCHSRYDRRYAASLRPSIDQAAQGAVGVGSHVVSQRDRQSGAKTNTRPVGHCRANV
jgi:hypothetical protein